MIRRQLVLIGAAVAVAASVWAIAGWRAREGVTADADICARVNVLDTALITILGRSFKGLPANPYYRRHPDELATALRNTRRAIRDLEAARC